MKFVVREFVMSDTLRVAALWHALSVLYEKMRPDYYGLKADSFDLLIPYVKQCAERGAILFVAESEERVIGFVIGYVIFRLPHLSIDKIGRIDNLYVEPEYRQQGVGSALVHKMYDFYKSVGVSTVEISTDTLNHRALKLYEKIGFQMHKVTLMK